LRHPTRLKFGESLLLYGKKCIPSSYALRLVSYICEKIRELSYYTT